MNTIESFLINNVLLLDTCMSNEPIRPGHDQRARLKRCNMYTCSAINSIMQQEYIVEEPSMRTSTRQYLYIYGAAHFLL